MEEMAKNQKLAPSLLCAAGLFAFIGSSSAWIRVSFIQIRGLDYWFGFITAISASVIIAAGIINFKKSLTTPKWRKKMGDLFATFLHCLNHHSHCCSKSS
jgi:hypothetical protein